MEFEGNARITYPEVHNPDFCKIVTLFEKGEFIKELPIKVTCQEIPPPCFQNGTLQPQYIMNVTTGFRDHLVPSRRVNYDLRSLCKERYQMEFTTTYNDATKRDEPALCIVDSEKNRMIYLSVTPPRIERVKGKKRLTIERILDYLRIR